MVHSDRVNCDVCGRFYDPGKGEGCLINQFGGGACNKCRTVAEQQNLKCPRCAGNLCHGEYHLKCDCKPETKVTRTGKNSNRFVVITA